MMMKGKLQVTHVNTPMKEKQNGRNIWKGWEISGCKKPFSNKSQQVK
jgi:hypothetical protein